MVFSFAYYYLGNRQEAEDVTQDVLMRFWRHFHDLEEEIVPKWLNRVTKNRSFDFLRSRTRRRRVVSEDAGDVVSLFAESDDSGPHHAMEQDAMRDRVRRAVLGLPEPYRSAIIFREILELPYRQTADALEIPLNTAKVHVHRGRRLLRDRLRKHRDRPEAFDG